MEADMQFKGTPGPWECRGNGEGLPPTRIGATIGPGIGGGYSSICVALLPSTGMRDDDSITADAYLIAAAPDLLEALRLGLAETMDYITRNNLGGENNHWLVMARAAISKALGAKA